MKRMLNMNYVIEVLDGRLNGSAVEVESNKDGFNNTTFTKKIGGRAKVSAVSQKANMKKYMCEVLKETIVEKTKEGKQVLSTPNPYANLFDDVFGFMLATKIELAEEEYKNLPEDVQKTFEKKGKKYTNNATKKRTSNLQMSSLINVSNRRVETEFNVCATSGDNMPYKIETYSGIMSGIANLNIGKIGEFTISDIASEYRDYTVKEAEVLGVENLSREDKLSRIEKTLNALEYMSIKGNQTNHLTDTKPKFIIMADYGWGNNVFQGVINKDGLDIEMLKESIDQNEEYRLSNIYIGVNKFFDKNNNLDLDTIREELREYDFIKVDNVHNTFKNYIKELRENI